jgi:hypothetical protein
MSMLWVNHAAAESDVILLGVHTDSDVGQIKAVRPMLRRGGVLWVLHRGQDAALATGISESARAAGLTPGRRVDLSASYVAIGFVS